MLPSVVRRVVLDEIDVPQSARDVVEDVADGLLIRGVAVCPSRRQCSQDLHCVVAVPIKLILDLAEADGVDLPSGDKRLEVVKAVDTVVLGCSCRRRPRRQPEFPPGWPRGRVVPRSTGRSSASSPHDHPRTMGSRRCFAHAARRCRSSIRRRRIPELRSPRTKMLAASLYRLDRFGAIHAVARVKQERHRQLHLVAIQLMDRLGGRTHFVFIHLKLEDREPLHGQLTLQDLEAHLDDIGTDVGVITLADLVDALEAQRGAGRQ